MNAQAPFDDRIVDVLAWNTSGNRIAFSSADWVDAVSEYENDQVRIVNVISNQVELSIPIDDLGVNYLSWQNNDNELTVININTDVKRFNSQNGSLIGAWSANGKLDAANIHPSNLVIALAIRRLITGSPYLMSPDKIIEIRDRITGALQQTLVLPIQADDDVDWIGWSPDGTRLAIVNHQLNALIYNWNGTNLSLQQQITFISNDSLPIYAAWGPNSRQIAISTRQSLTSPSITIFNSEDGTAIRQLSQSTGTEPVAWNIQTNLIASREGWAARIWNGSTGQVVEDLDYTNQYFSALAWSPNGTLAIGRQVTYDELVQNPNLTGIVTQRPSSLPTLTPTPTPTPTPSNTPTATPANGTFPTTGVLDNFNRANGALGSNWTGFTSGISVLNNKMNVDSDGDIYWEPASFNANQEAYVTLASIDPNAAEIDLLLKVQGATWPSGVIEVLYNPAGSKVQVFTYTSSQDWVQRGADIPVSFAAGDQFGARAKSDGTVEVYKNGSLVGSRDISAWPYNANGGKLGLWMIGIDVMNVDDFGGGDS